MFGRRRLSVTASFVTCPTGQVGARIPSGTGVSEPEDTIEAGRRAAQRTAPSMPRRTLGGRIARRRALAESSRGAG